jgi:hypothetical protein
MYTYTCICYNKVAHHTCKHVRCILNAISICMYAHVYAYIYIYIYKCMCIIHACIYIYICMYAYLYMHILYQSDIPYEFIFSYTQDTHLLTQAHPQFSIWNSTHIHNIIYSLLSGTQHISITLYTVYYLELNTYPQHYMFFSPAALMVMHLTYMYAQVHACILTGVGVVVDSGTVVVCLYVYVYAYVYVYVHARKKAEHNNEANNKIQNSKTQMQL